MADIIKKIDTEISNLQENDLDSWVVPELLAQLGSKLNFLAGKAYGFNDESTVPNAAFKERAKLELRSACHTFIFKLQHWKKEEKRSIGPYLFKTLTRLSDRIKWETGTATHTNVLVCPACKEFNSKEYLVSEDRLWRCPVCTSECVRVSNDLKDLKYQEDKNLLATLQAKLKLCSVFSLHTRKGYRCPDCQKFIPESANGKFGIACPYPDCFYFGSISELELMSHPLGLAQRSLISFNQTLVSKNSNNSVALQDLFLSEDIDVCTKLEITEKYENEYNVLLQVIEDQLNQVKLMSSSSTMVQKTLMYEAYKIMISKYPEEMVSYLIHEKQNSEFPLQCKIFQEYVSLIENYLPFTIQKSGKEIDIMDLTDPNLSLFEGISEFEAEVEHNHIIPNKTQETYTGGRKFKNWGPYFIGKLIDVQDNSGMSLLDKVKEYSFVSIRMDSSVPVGTPVFVKHFRIIPHYEMKSLIFLQRIRRSLVDKVYFRLNKKKRIPRKNGA